MIGATIQGATKFAPHIEKASKFLQNKITKQDRDLLGKFGELVETGKGRQAMGDVGTRVQSLAKQVFGRQAGGWGHQKMKGAFDKVVERVDQLNTPTRKHFLQRMKERAFKK